MQWRSRGGIGILQNFILVLICLVNFIMLLIFGQSGQQDEDMVMMKFIVLGTKFILRLRTPRSLYQMAISVRCHTGRDVITKSNEIESKDQWDQVQRFAGGLLPRFG